MSHFSIHIFSILNSIAGSRCIVSIGFCTSRHISKGLFRLSNQLCDELRSVGSDAVTCKNDVRRPREQFVADDLNHRTRLLRIPPAAVQDILVLETEIARKGNAFAAQLRRIDREIEAVSRHEQRMEL